MHAGVTKEIDFPVPFWNSCAVYFLRGSRAILLWASAAGVLARGLNCSGHGVFNDLQFE
jgi:hypothetical protein